MGNRDVATVYIVEDEEAVRFWLENLFQANGFHARGFGDPHRFLDEFEPEQIGTLVLDYRLGSMDGLTLYQQIRAKGSSLPTVLITAYGTVPLAVEAIKAGMLDVLEKPFAQEKLIEVVREAIDRHRSVVRKEQRRRRFRESLNQLSPRETEVLRFVLHGRTSKQIAQILGLSSKTIEHHRSRILRKTGTRSIAGLVAHVVQMEPSLIDDPLVFGEGEVPA